MRTVSSPHAGLAHRQWRAPGETEVCGADVAGEEAAISEVFGLASADARARLATYGPNRLVVRDRLAWLKEVFGLAFDPMSVMLVIAAGSIWPWGSGAMRPSC